MANATYVNFTTTATSHERRILTVSYITAAGTVLDSWGDEFTVAA